MGLLTAKYCAAENSKQTKTQQIVWAFDFHKIYFRFHYRLNYRDSLSKIAWKVATKNTCLWVKMVSSKYLRQVDFWEAECGHQSSWVWKSILKVKKHLDLGRCFVVGNGLDISVWSDPWVPNISGFKPAPLLPDQARLDFKVSDFIDPSTGQWNRPLI